METSILLCKSCNHFVHHTKITVVSFQTKIRTLEITSYKCSNCEEVQFTHHEKENTNYKVWD